MNLDKFYTSPDIADFCFSKVVENVKISDHDLCIEPSAGNGSFIRPIKKMFKRYMEKV